MPTPGLKNRLLVGCVAISLAAGCAAFRAEDVRLSEAQIVAIAQRAAVSVSELPSLSPDRLKQAASEALGVAINEIRIKVDSTSGKVEKIEAELPSLAGEAASSAGGAALDKIAKNPTTVGIGAAILAALGSIAALIAKRRAAREGKIATGGEV